MSSLVKTMLGTGLLAATLLWSGASNACQLALDSVYTVSPLVDDGLSRAERVNCALGELHYYDEKQGWLSMRDEHGEPLRVRDMAGVMAPDGEFLVVILEDRRIAVRRGGPGDGDFFVKNATHWAYYGFDPDGAHIEGLKLGAVSFDGKIDQFHVQIATDDPLLCSDWPDEESRVVWHWNCVEWSDGFKAAVVQQAAAVQLAAASAEEAAAASSTRWTCRNTDLEVACGEDSCAVTPSHTPMFVTVDQNEMSVCAYSGCWSGSPAATITSGSFLMVTGRNLPFSTNPDDKQDVTVTIERASRVATILVAGEFANPATCEPN